MWVETLDAPGCEVCVNHSLVKSYLKAVDELAEIRAKNDLPVHELARFPDVLTVQKTPEDEEAVWLAVKTVADKALARFVEMREQEGRALARIY